MQGAPRLHGHEGALGPASELAGALTGREGRLFFFFPQSFKKDFWPLCSTFIKLRSWHPIPSLHGK